MLKRIIEIFFKLSIAALCLGLSACSEDSPINNDTNQPMSTYQGNNFSGWIVDLGDAIYNALSEPPVNLNDIDTLNYRDHSELLANINRRRIMAHNITFKRIIDDNAFKFSHTCSYKFRLPYLPATNNSNLNGETVEGGIFVWDGKNTRLDYGVAFQWKINPWDSPNFGKIQCWADSIWLPVGYLKPDTLWHELQIVIDYQTKATEMKIDGNIFSSRYSSTRKPSTWARETAARLQAEIVSIYPEPAGIRVLHKAEFKDWKWVWKKQ